MLRLKNIERRQAQAPVFSLGYGISWDTNPELPKKLFSAWFDHKTLSWNLTATLDISPVFSGAGKRDDQQEKVDNANFENSIDELRKRKNSEKVFIQSMINDLTDQSRLSLELVKNLQKECEDTKKLLDSGSVTELDYTYVKTELVNRTNVYKNTEDQLWEYRFLEQLY
jgi:hypothetical protein